MVRRHEVPSPFFSVCSSWRPHLRCLCRNPDPSLAGSRPEVRRSPRRGFSSRVTEKSKGEPRTPCLLAARKTPPERGEHCSAWGSHDARHERPSPCKPRRSKRRLTHPRQRSAPVGFGPWLAEARQGRGCAGLTSRRRGRPNQKSGLADVPPIGRLPRTIAPQVLGG